jgi:hypothetical protein
MSHGWEKVVAIVPLALLAAVAGLTRPWHTRLLALTVALTACGSACGRQESTASDGSTGGDSTSAGAGGGTGGAGVGGAGGSGGGGACPAPAAGTLSFEGLHTTTFDNTMEPESASFGDPNTSTLSASDKGSKLFIAAKDATWEVEIDLHLDAHASLPLSITPKSFPSYVRGGSFTHGMGLANDFSNDDTFTVNLTEAGCRIKGTFSGGTSSSDGFEILTIANGSFDVAVTKP